ncbi:hypothetical protein JXA88_10035 [Candidatus Fermentibacteria bacterium]|nr:hypothetical protein [Candidatus Fermentibacteria bacterium]
MHRCLFTIVVLALTVTSCAEEPRHRVLLLAPPGDESMPLRDAVERAGASVTTMDPFPAWQDAWEWIADPEDTGAGGWAFADGPGWQPMETGAPWQARGIRYTGVAWYRRTLRSAGVGALSPCLTLRALEDSVTVFLNGRRIGAGGGYWGDLDAELAGLRPGLNTLAVRVVNPEDSGDPNRGGLAGPTDLSVRCTEETLAGVDLLILSSRVVLSGASGAAIENWARTGGTVVCVFYDKGRLWEDTPLERILPTVLGPSAERVGAVLPRAVGPLGAGMGPDEGLVDVTAAIHLPDHPHFARPGTRETAKWNLSPLAWAHRVEITGDDPRASPLLTSARYGAGRVMACSAPALLSPSLIAAMRAQTAAPHDAAPVGTVWGSMGLPWNRLGLMGLAPAEQDDADIVVVDGAAAPSLVRAAVAAGKTALVLNPEVLSDSPDLTPWALQSRAAHDPVPLVDAATWSALSERSEPRVLQVSLPSGQNHQICVEGSRFGPVRGVWSDDALGRPCADGSWVLPPCSTVQVGVWGASDRVPLVYPGGRAVLCTGSGITLDQPLDRPTFRQPVQKALWQWEDKEPALAVRTVGRGRVASFSVPLRLEDPRELDWSDVQASKQRFLHEDTSQLLVLAIRELVSEDMLLGPIDSGPGGITVGLRRRNSRPMHVRYRFRDWQRSLLCSHDLDLRPGAGTTSFVIPWPSRDELVRYETATGDTPLWLEVALLSEEHQRCLFRVETAVRRPGPTVTVWHTPLSRRTPQRFATWPRADADFPQGMGPAGQYPLFMPGEEIRFFVESWDPAHGQVAVTARDVVQGTPVQLVEIPVRRSGSPWSVSEWRMSPPPPSVYRVDARLGDAQSHARVLVSSPTDLRSCIWDRAKGVQVLGSLYEFGDPLQFAQENLCAHADTGIAWGPFARTRPGQPWCDFLPNSFCFLPNGVHYRAWNAEIIRRLARHTWTGETLTISASLVDGFNGIPWPSAFVHPQHLAVFARWMQSRGEPALIGLAADSIAALALGDLNPDWRYFVATEVALPAHRIVRDELQSVSSGSHLTDQFDLPLFPTILRIPEVERFAESWQELFSLSSSDAWNVRAGRDYHVPTYLVSLGKALAPKGRVGHYHMEMLGGIGAERIAKAELIRRQNADLFWMMAASDEGWVPVETYADGGGVSWLGGWQTWLALSSRSTRGGHVAFQEDWHALQELYATAEAIRPRRPRGFVMAAVGPRLPSPGQDEVIMGDSARLFGMLREAGLPISGMARLDKVGTSTLPDGVIIPVPGALSSEERAGLRLCLDRGIPVGVVGMGLTPRLIASYVGIDEAVLGSPSVKLLPEGNVKGPFWDDGATEDYAAVRRFVHDLKGMSSFDVSAPEGISSYAFDGPYGLVVVVLEERGEARTAPVLLRTTGRVRHAAELLGGNTLGVKHIDRGVIIEVVLPAAGAALVQVRDE